MWCILSHWHIRRYFLHLIVSLTSQLLRPLRARAPVMWLCLDASFLRRGGGRAGRVPFRTAAVSADRSSCSRSLPGGLRRSVNHTFISGSQQVRTKTTQTEKRGHFQRRTDGTPSRTRPAGFRQLTRRFSRRHLGSDRRRRRFGVSGSNVPLERRRVPRGVMRRP